ncbi:MAG: N-methyl-D-aspartate receptor NMDAR2C subunit [Planctomycetaceae bacterium]
MTRILKLHDWLTTWDQLGLRGSREDFDDLLDRYRESHRAYHTLQHLRECFDQLATAGQLATRLGEVKLAVWFHDVIYDPRKSDNEERSRDYAQSVLTRADADVGLKSRVENLILATKHTSDVTDSDAKLLVDIDLAILGSDALRFDEYELQVRQEYAWVPTADFRTGRSRILSQFLARPRIFLTDWFFNRFERPARANLQRSLDQLSE